MLQIIFGDDEHTAAEGPYSRVMKTRKWLYLSSAAAFFVGKGLYNEAVAAELLQVISLPENLLGSAIGAATSYLLVQYLILVFQLGRTYDIVLTERLAFRRDDELKSARETMANLSRQLRDVEGTTFDAWNSERSERVNSLAEKIAELSDEIDATVASDVKSYMEISLPGKLQVANYRISRAKAMRARIRKQYQLAAMGLDNENPSREDSDQYRQVQQDLESASDKYQTIHKLVPANRSGYRFAEKLIDGLRVGLPLAVATWSLSILARHLF